MDKLGNLLPRVIARQPNHRHLLELRVRLAFADLVGPALAAACEGLDLNGAALTVTTSNPALAHQLRLDSEQLLERLNEHSLGRRLKTIRIRTGQGPRPGSRH